MIKCTSYGVKCPKCGHIFDYVTESFAPIGEGTLEKLEEKMED